MKSIVLSLRDLVRFVVSPETDHDSIAATEPNAKLRNDEAKFIDIGRSQLFLTQEHTSMNEMQAGSATPEGQRVGPTLVEDERRFVEMSRSLCFLTREHVIFDYT